MKYLKSVNFYNGKIFIGSLCQFTLNLVTVGSFVSMSIQLQPHVTGLDKELSHYFDCIFCVDVVLVLQYVSNPLKLCVYVQGENACKYSLILPLTVIC